MCQIPCTNKTEYRVSRNKSAPSPRWELGAAELTRANLYSATDQPDSSPSSGTSSESAKILIISQRLIRCPLRLRNGTTDVRIPHGDTGGDSVRTMDFRSAGDPLPQPRVRAHPGLPRCQAGRERRWSPVKEGGAEAEAAVTEDSCCFYCQVCTRPPPSADLSICCLPAESYSNGGQNSASHQPFCWDNPCATEYTSTEQMDGILRPCPGPVGGSRHTDNCPVSVASQPDQKEGPTYLLLSHLSDWVYQ
ncbi:hypothetical protein IF1G_04994 [Cordyceps javanica]|uniref:Uncharacterized protein n=1 Tax=Cordyceps javanica TaxID=43265 RepID=A0A545V3X4_9HYPO|nr:hypothetical protein IF1G_04994 [Cordyceps javanica]